MTPKRLRWMWILIPVAMLAACHKDDTNSNSSTGAANSGTSSSAPAPANVQGVWSGAVQSPVGATNATLTLAQSMNQVSGTFATPALSGNVNGTVSGNTVTLGLVPAPSFPCSGQFSANGTVAGNSMNLALNASAGLVAKDLAVSVSTGPVGCPAGSLTGQATFNRLTASSSLQLNR